MDFSRDALAEWFLRLNGFFTILNFVVHPVGQDEGHGQRTDADVLGIRWPHRKEVVAGKPLADHELFCGSKNPLVIIAEVKRGLCRINGPWSRPQDDNVGHVLRSLGCLPPAEVASAAQSLYQHSAFKSRQLEIHIACFGSKLNRDLPPGVWQIRWVDAIGFAHDRYQAFWKAKRENEQWPAIGRFLWEESRSASRADFIAKVLEAFELPPSNQRVNPPAGGPPPA